MRNANAMRIGPLLAAIVIGLGLALWPAVSSEPAAAAPGAIQTVNVGMGGTNFVPNSVTINTADTVNWVGVAGFHSTTSGTCCTANGTWDSGMHPFPFTHTLTFNKAGTYLYFCSVHGASMTGTIIVQGPTAVSLSSFSAEPPAAETAGAAAGTAFPDGLASGLALLGMAGLALGVFGRRCTRSQAP
jgi:plastocyanin